MGEGGPGAGRVGHGILHEQFFIFLPTLQAKGLQFYGIGKIVILANGKQSCYNGLCSSHSLLHPALSRQPSSV